jgi:predicted RNA methylase
MNTTGTKQYWSMTEGVFNCLIDTKRTKAFAKAIKHTVKKGDVVVDMGTGSGILAILAAKAGARKVYAIEYDKNNIKTLHETFQINHVAEIIEIIEGSILDIALPEKVDVVIGEMIATALIEELQVLAMNHIHKFTKKGVRVLLNKYDTYADLVYNNENFYGNTFKILRYEYPEENSLKSTAFTHKQHVAHFNFEKIIKLMNINQKFSLKINKTGSINSLRLSGKTTFFDKTSLAGTFAYDYPLILPIPTLSVEKNDEFEISLKYKVCAGLEKLEYTVQKK